MKQNDHNDNNDQHLFTLLVIIPIGILCVALIWSKYGFGCGLLTAAIYTIGVLCKFFIKSK